MTTTRDARSLGWIIWRGRSAIGDRGPIAAVVKRRGNAKTGREMPQLFTLCTDERGRFLDPRETIADGTDTDICGYCPHRGTYHLVGGELIYVGRSCYVDMRGLVSQWKALQRGRYDEATGTDRVARYYRRAMDGWMVGRRVRLGAYGDPAALPLRVLDRITRHAVGHTGYTHQWRDRPPSFARYLMASAESDQDERDAMAEGYRTFRVRSGEDPIGSTVDGVRSTECPAYTHGATCDACALCAGSMTDRPGVVQRITIRAHGLGTIAQAVHDKRTALTVNGRTEQ